MADPVTLGVIGLGTSLAGGLLSAKGQEDSGAAQQQMFNYQAAVAKINSDIDLQNADWARNTGEITARQYGERASQTRGQIIANQGASNIAVGQGSSGEVTRSFKDITALDLGQIRSNAAKTAYDYDVKSTMDLNQSTLDIMSGTNAKKAGDINATASILGTVGSVSSKWFQGQQAGMWGGTSKGGIDLYGPEFTKVGTA